MAELGIGEVARRAGIATSAIRYYESEGMIPRPERRSGRRVYDASIVERLALIRLAKQAGFTVAEVKRLLGGFARRAPPGERWRTLAEGKLQELDRRIAEAQRMKRVLRVVMHCKCPTFEDCSRAMCGQEADSADAGRLGA
jgi:MerR family redox-sensitive transcriptional activator SoxR